MATAKLSDMVSRLGRLPGPPAQDATDPELLGRFLADRDEAAFAELVRRHGPTVFGVCRRVTGDHHLAEDAFQAVFVVLAAKAGSVRPRAALPAWLYGVAYRTALRARTMKDRRRRREAAVGRLPEQATDAADAAEATDLAAVLDAEIARLPEHLRVPVLLCELEGRSRPEAAGQLGIPEGTLSSRLAAARKALAARLRGRGVALSAAGLTAAFGQVSAATVPPDLTAKAVAAATSPGVVPAPVAALSNGVLRIMFAQKLKMVPVALGLVAAAVLATGLLPASDSPGAGVPSAAGSPPGSPNPAPRVVLADPPKPAAKPTPAAKKPLPKGPNKLLFWREGELVRTDPDGKNEQVAVPKTVGIHPLMFALSPDGSKAAFMSRPADAAPVAGGTPFEAHIFLRDLDKDGPGVDLGEAGMVAWSGDGMQLAACRFTDARNPADVRATHSVYALATKKWAKLDLPDNHILTDWSRDGRYFLTTKLGKDRDNPIGGVCVLDREGTLKKALTDEKQPGMMGKFSPDGRRVLLMLVELKDEAPAGKEARGPARRPLRRLGVIDVATGKLTPVKDVPLNADLQGFCWSPDGKRIAYVWREVPAGDPKGAGDQETVTTLVTCDPDGGNQKTVTTAKAAGPGIITIGGVDWR